MAKRGKGGKNIRRPPKSVEKPGHKFLPAVTAAFVAGVARVSPKKALPEKASDQQVMQMLHQLEGALGVKIDIINPRLFRVRNPRPACLPNGQRNNIQIKWHGSSPANGIAILRTGFRTGVSGMFGAGIYVGDKAKARIYSGYAPAVPAYAGHGAIHWPSGMVTAARPATPAIPARPGMMIMVEVALGRVFQAEKALGKLRSPPEGFDSVQGVARVTKSWSDKVTLNHDEWVVYNPCQVSVQEIHLLG